MPSRPTIGFAFKLGLGFALRFRFIGLLSLLFVPAALRAQTPFTTALEPAQRASKCSLTGKSACCDTVPVEARGNTRGPNPAGLAPFIPRSQSPSATGGSSRNGNRRNTLGPHLVINILRDQEAIWTWPARINREQAKWLIPFAGATAALIATDRYSGEDGGEFSANPVRNIVARDISALGSVYGGVTLAGSFYLAGRLSHNAHAQETGILAGEAAIDIGIVAGVFKVVVRRARPSSGSGEGDFFTGGSSFPSGHSALVWSIASVVACEYPRRWVQIAAYGTAAAISISRFGAHAHFLSDILVGSAIGYATGHYVYRAHHDPGLDRTATAPVMSRLFNSITGIGPAYDPQLRQYGLRLTVGL